MIVACKSSRGPNKSCITIPFHPRELLTSRISYVVLCLFVAYSALQLKNIYYRGLPTRRRDDPLLPTSTAALQPADTKTVPFGVRPPSNRAQHELPETCGDDPTSLFSRDAQLCIPGLNLSSNADALYAVDANGARYAFCAPPKCSSSLHRLAALRILGDPNWKYAYKATLWKQLRLNASQLPDFMLNNSVRKYILVRNPMVRTLSGYLMRRENSSMDPALAPERFAKWVLDLYPEDGNISANFWKQQNQHLRAQSTMCGFHHRDLWTYFTILKVEDSTAVADYLDNTLPEAYLRGWGSEANISLRDRIITPASSSRIRGSADKTQLFYKKKEVFERVALAFADDIRILKYEKEVQEMRDAYFSQ